jgi:hypothetical protein
MKNFGSPDEFTINLFKDLLIDLSIWLPKDFFRNLPIILPYVVRDNSCRQKKGCRPEQWGSANSGGFLRDDNSLIKGIVRSFHVNSKKIPAYDGRKIGNGFVASHIWGKVRVQESEMISSRHYMLNTFVPNLVWLPVQISKLTDREGSIAQRLLQTISWKIYGDIDMAPEISTVWKALKCKTVFSENTFDPERINYFIVPNDWLTKRIKNLVSEMETILSIDIINIKQLSEVKSSRYLPSLREISMEQKQEMNEWLHKYKTLLQHSTSISTKD